METIDIPRYNKKEAAKLLNISRSTLEELMRTRQIRFYKGPGERNGAVKFSERQIMDYLKQTEIKSEHDRPEEA